MVDLIDIVLEGFKGVVDWFIGLFADGLRSGYDALSEEMFGTPTPKTDGSFVFGDPVNGPWPAIRDVLVGGEIMLISLFLLMMCVQGRHTIRIFNIGSAYETRRTRKTAWVGAFLIITWYWVSILCLYLVDGFTIALIPSLGSLGESMLNLLNVSLSNPALTLVLAIVGGLAMWVMEALFYIREILLLIYVYGMPVSFAVAYGNIPVLSQIALGFSKRFVPLAILPLPAAVIFKGYEVLYSEGGLTPGSPFLRYMVAASLPLVALYITWKTFTFATPLTARVISGVTRGAALVGGVAAGAAVGGAGVATTAAKWGPKAGASHAAAQSLATRGGDTADSDSTPSYRRTENDPSHTTAETDRDARGMRYDRGIH